MDIMDEGGGEAGESAENPVAAQPKGEEKSTSSQAREALEEALLGLKDGSVSEAEAAAVVEALIDARMSASDGNSGLKSAIKSVFAHLTEAPT